MDWRHLLASFRAREHSDFSGRQDAQRRSDGKPLLELLRRILGILNVDLNRLQQEVLLDPFNPVGSNFGKLSIVVLNLSFYSFAGKHWFSSTFVGSIPAVFVRRTPAFREH
jgi:hypothetical protein